MEGSKSLWIPEIVEQVTNYMFVATPELEVQPTASLPPPLPHPTTALGSFWSSNHATTRCHFLYTMARKIHCHGLTAASSSSGASAPPTTRKSSISSFHLTSGAQQWFMCLTQDKAVTDWGYFYHCVNKRFGPLTRHNPLGELVSLRKTGTIDEYTERFLVHVVPGPLTSYSRSTSTPPAWWIP